MEEEEEDERRTLILRIGWRRIAMIIIHNHWVHGPSIGVLGPILHGPSIGVHGPSWDRVSNGSIVRYATASCAMYLCTSTLPPLVFHTHHQAQVDWTST